MKKNLLMAGVASVLTLSAVTQANAGYLSDFYHQMQPYIGADYVYNHIKFGSPATHMKKNFNSGMVNLGARMYENFGLETFYQQSAKSNRTYDGEKRSAKFLAYGADMYGYMPLMCSSLNLIGSVGLANYRFDFKYPDIANKRQNRIGYRAGVGLQYDFTEHFAARVVGRYDYIGMKRVNNLKEVTAGLRYTF